MAADYLGRGPEADRARPHGVGFLIFRAVAGTVLVLMLLAGLGVAGLSVAWLVELSGQEIQPPGQIVAAVPLLGTAVGAAAALAGGAGLVFLVWLSRWLSRRPHPD